MWKLILCVAALSVAACANTPPPVDTGSPCLRNEASWECQVDRYGKVNM